MNKAALLFVPLFAISSALAVLSATQSRKPSRPAPLGPWHVPGHRAFQVTFLAGAKLELVRKAIAEGADVNAPLESGSQPMPTLWTPLYWAAYRADVAKMALLLQHHANVSAKSKYGVSVLWVAAVSGNAKGVKLLLDHGAMAKQKNAEGVTLADTIASIATHSSNARFNAILVDLKAHGG